MQNRNSRSEVGRWKYLDFELEIGEGNGQEYPVKVVHSPAGEASEVMHFPFGETVLDNRLMALQIALLSSTGERLRGPSREELTVQKFGQDLFDALLVGEVRGRYDVSLNEAESQGKGLRLKLRITPPRLATLPWELMYDSRQGEYVCLSRNTPVVRYLDLSRPVQPLSVTSPLRILGMVACPSDLPQLDVAQEKRRVEEAIGKLQARGLVTLSWLEGQTWRELQETMRRDTWHVFHFIGHGGFDSKVDEGYIALVDEQHGKAHRLAATKLRRLLADDRSLRLVLLNACESARGGELDIFSSTAAVLVQRGIPAVLAMQYPITDKAALEFSRSFYAALADGLPVDASVAEARKAISLNTLEWGTPVLYMRSSDGVLFTIQGQAEGGEAQESGEGETRRKTASDQEAEGLREFYDRGVEQLRQGSWRDAIETFTEVIQRDPGYRDVWGKRAEAKRKARENEDYQEKLKNLELLYDAGRWYFEKRKWQAAINYFNHIVDSGEMYKDTENLLERATKQLNLETRYTEALEAIEEEKWEEVVKALEAVESIDPNYGDCLAQLEYARAQHRLQSLYEQALDCVHDEEWTPAIEKLEEITQEDPAYSEAAQKLEQAREQKRIADLYSAGVGFMEIGKWSQAIDRFTGVIRLAGAGYKKVEVRLEKARQQQALEESYSRGERFLRQKKWRDAVDQFEKVRAQDPNYQGVQANLNIARKRLRMKQLCEQVESCFQAEDWQEAVEVLEKLSRLDPEDGGTTVQLEEARGKLRLDTLYSEGMAHFERKKWRKTKVAFEEILRIEPGYRDAEAMLKVVQEHLAPRNLTGILQAPFWRMIGGVAVVTVLIVATTLLVNGDFLNLIPSPTLTPKPPELCNGDFEDNFECWQHGGALDQSVECDGDRCFAVLGNPSYECEGGVPVGEAWMKQSFKVPDTISPTLSLRYRVFSYDLYNSDSFQVSINGKSVLQFGNEEWDESSCAREAWDSGWQTTDFDLGAHSGERVELSLQNVNSVDGGWNTWSYVDDVEIR